MQKYYKLQIVVNPIMKAYDIRQVTEADLPLLGQLERSTFTETFQSVYHADDLKAFLEARKSDAAIRQEWSQPGAAYYIIAEDGTAAGFLKINMFRQPDNGTLLPEPVMEVEKIYVQKAFQGKKLGKALMEYAYDIARKNFVCTVWLGVWEHNLSARKIYEKEGYTVFGEHSFFVGSQRDRDLLMRKAL